MSVVEEAQVFPVHLYAKVIRGLFSDMTNSDIGDWGAVFVGPLFRRPAFTAVLIDTAPDEYVDVEVSFAEGEGTS